MLPLSYIALSYNYSLLQWRFYACVGGTVNYEFIRGRIFLISHCERETRKKSLSAGSMFACFVLLGLTFTKLGVLKMS